MPQQLLRLHIVKRATLVFVKFVEGLGIELLTLTVVGHILCELSSCVLDLKNSHKLRHMLRSTPKHSQAYSEALLDMHSEALLGTNLLHSLVVLSSTYAPKHSEAHRDTRGN